MKFFLLSIVAGGGVALGFPVQVKVRVDQADGALPPMWRFFGADEPNYATMKHGDALLGELGKLAPDEVFFRTHSLLVTGDGKPALKWGSTNVYTEDDAGNSVYDWKIVDGIFDAYRKNRVRPYVQIGFMPEALSRKPQPYRHHWTPQLRYEEIYTGWAHPPKDYEKWEELVYQWAKHSNERYGRDEVLRWYWQTWNEPNIPYWQGTRDEFFRLHDHAVHAVRRAIPNAKVGGPDVAGGKGGDFLDAFLRHTLSGKNLATGGYGSPLDFVSFHAKGKPEHRDGHVVMGISHQLRDIDGAFACIASYEHARHLPIVIGESDPEGCAACQGPNLAYRNGNLYSAYTAASFARKWELARRHGVNLEGALTWAFSFEDQPWFAGFRTLATHGVDKPVLNTFRLFSSLGDERVHAVSDHATSLDEILRAGVRGPADVGVIATREKDRYAVLLWHYHDVNVPGDAAEVSLQVDGLEKGKWQVTRRTVDEDEGNAYTMWLAQGSPPEPTAAQIKEMIEASVMKKQKIATTDGGTETLKLTLSRQAVTLLEWVKTP